MIPRGSAPIVPDRPACSGPGFGLGYSGSTGRDDAGTCRDDRADVTARDWALRYAKAGWRVYPVDPGAKKACFTGWQQNATTDPEIIEGIWRQEPTPNIGLICGEAFAVFVVEGPHLPAFFAYLDAGGYVLPETPFCSTGRGGLHLYVKSIASVSTTRKLHLADTHIGEFKTTGGVVAPPSITVSRYRWLWWPDPVVVAEAPGWLRSLLADPSGVAPGVRQGEERAARPGRRSSDPAAALDALARAVRDQPAGNRNAVLFWAACRALEEGIRADIATAVLRRAALAAGLPDAESRATIRSALRRAGVLV